ncbi:MAG: hypothetical protein KDI71_15970, partial [Xanthomonadales bacterium]|nr:hypothetical protein [Xanthomonadales bacterium]
MILARRVGLQYAQDVVSAANRINGRAATHEYQTQHWRISCAHPDRLTGHSDTPNLASDAVRSSPHPTLAPMILARRVG